MPTFHSLLQYFDFSYQLTPQLIQTGVYHAVITCFLLGYVAYKRNPKAAELVKYTRKEKLLFDFFCLVIEFHTVSRDVAFYAKKMCVSAKHLTMVITDMSGRSAKDWIIDYSLLEIKALLRDSDLEIKEVASRTNFQSNSVMTRFFREHTGMTPSEYRERIYVKNEIEL